MKKLILNMLKVLLVIILIFLVWEDIVFYKSRWDIWLPNPIKTKVIITLGPPSNDGLVIKKYTNFSKKRIIKKGQFKKINPKKLEEIYDKAVEKALFVYFRDKQEKIFENNFNKKELFNEKNYYLFAEQNIDEYPFGHYYFLLLILDTENNLIYEVTLA